MDTIRALHHLLAVLFALLLEAARFLSLSFRSNAALRAGNLFLRRQLALYVDRRVKPRRANDGKRMAMVFLSRFFARKDALTIVKPGTLVTWHRKGFGFSWDRKSKRRGRPQLPMELQRLIVQMAKGNVTWREERIAAELLLKLGIRLSPRTVRRYMPESGGTDGWPRYDRWMMFVRNQAKATLACDFFVTVTADLRMLYVLVIMEIGSWRIIHFDVTGHPTSEWTLQQFRETMEDGQAIRFLIHDRDSIYSADLDLALEGMGLKVVKTPVRAPQANAHCEPLIGTILRECLDFMIPLNERHLRWILRQWVGHYNRARPHSSLGPGIPDSCVVPQVPGASRHQIAYSH